MKRLLPYGVAAVFVCLAVASRSATAGQTLYASVYQYSQIEQIAPGGGAATPFYQPYGTNPIYGYTLGVTTDALGNVYFANYREGEVFKVTPDGQSSSVYATGFSGYGSPDGLAFDSQGNLFVTTDYGMTVDKVAPGGGAATVYATYTTEQDAIAIDSKGDIFTLSNAAGTVSEIVHGTTTPITILSGLNNPGSLAVDSSGSLYVSLFNSGVVDKYSNGVLSTYATGFTTGVTGIAFDATGDLFGLGYYSSNGISDVYEVAPGGGTATVYAGIEDGGGQYYLALSPAAAVPEPAGVLLLGVGIATVALAIRLRWRSVAVPCA